MFAIECLTGNRKTGADAPSYLRTGMALVLGVSMLSACSSPMIEPTNKCWMDKREIISRLDLKSVFDDAAKSLCSEENDDLSLPLLVSDLVEIQSYKTDSHGILMGEYFRGSLVQACKQKVIQADLSRDFKLTNQGLTALSRDPTKVRRSEISANHAMVGVYDWQNNKLVLMLKQVTLDNSTVKKLVTKEITWRCENSALGTSSFSSQVR
jgi:hypothetical protein